MNYLIVGKSGIGQALASTLRNAGHVVTIIGRPEIEATQQDSVEYVIQRLENLPDVVINTVGFLHDEQFKPERSLMQFTPDHLWHSIKINTLPTSFLANALSKKMKKDTKLKLVTFSARVSSIEDNHLGGWHSYRMSKCALNMLIKNISIEWLRRFPNAGIYGYHPGTVDTPLSKPFQANVPPEKLFSPEKAAKYCLEVLQNLTVAESGNLFDWQGKRIPA